MKRSFILLSVILSLFLIRYRFAGEDGNAYRNIIDGDGRGYYAYLPAIFIYHDLDFRFFDIHPELFPPLYAKTFLLGQEGHYLNKYTCGEALLLLPFFALAALHSKVFCMPVDGYNPAFHVYCGIGVFLFLLAGLWHARKLLVLYKLPPFAINVALLHWPWEPTSSIIR